jgi:subtilisin family serine protease
MFRNKELIFSLLTILLIFGLVFGLNWSTLKSGSNSSSSQTAELEKRKARLEQITSISRGKVENSSLGKDKLVAIFDTGVDARHTELTDNLVYSACFSSNSDKVNSLCKDGLEFVDGQNLFDKCENDVFGECGHGTAVASLITGKYGLSSKAKILSFQIYSQSNLGLILNVRDFQRALEKLLELINRQKYLVNVLNLSFNTDELFENYCDDQYPEISLLLQKLIQKQVQIVVSSGNLGITGKVQFPACFKGLTVVGSLDNGKNGTVEGEISKFSNQNSSLITSYQTGNYLEVATFDPKDKTKTIQTEGTSLAAAIQSGLFLDR